MSFLPYAPWVLRYDHEDFSRAQDLAAEITEQDRQSGAPVPAAGYSQTRFDEAITAVRAAQGYGRDGAGRVLL